MDKDENLQFLYRNVSHYPGGFVRSPVILGRVGIIQSNVHAPRSGMSMSNGDICPGYAAGGSMSKCIIF